MTARDNLTAAPVDPGAATVERLPVPLSALLALAVLLAGSIPSILLAVYGGGLACFYLGLTGIVASGIAGMVLGWHLPPADLALGTSATPRRQAR